MAAINSRLYRNTLELLRLYNSSTSFRNVFNRLLNRPRVYYKGIPLKTYVYTLTSLNHQYFYRFLKITPERINRLFTNFYINTGSRQALERSVTQYPLTENEILEHNELAGIEKLPEDEKKENFFDKFLEKNSQGEKTDEKKEEVKQPESQPQSTRATQFRQNLAARLKTFQTPNIIKNISSKGQIGARKLLSKLTPTQLASLGLGLTGGLLGLISNGSAGALIGGAAGAITPTLINKGYGQLAVQTAYVVGIRTSRALNSLNNIKLGLPGLTLAFKNPLLIVAIGAGLLLFILMPEGLLESSALLPSYTSLSGTGSGSGSSATGNLTITKTGPAAVNNGENITYQISITYNGTDTADIEITDKLPSGTDFLSASDGGQNQAGTVKWTLAGVSSAQKTVTLTLKTTQPDIYVSNTATATVTKTSGGGGGGGGSIAACKFSSYGGAKDPIKSARLRTLIEEVAAKTGVPAAAIATIAMHESPNFVVNADDNHDAFFNRNFTGVACKPHFGDTNWGASKTGALGLMQVQPPGSILSSYFVPDPKPGAYDSVGVNLGLEKLGRNLSSLTLMDFCDVRTNLYLGAGVMIDKNGGVPPKTADEVRLTAYRYVGDGTYADAAKADFIACQAVSTPTPPPSTSTASCPIQNGTISCGSYSTPINGCGHCNPATDYPGGTSSAQCTASFAQGTKSAIDIAGNDLQNIFLPTVNGHVVKWTYKGEELGSLTGEGIEKYKGIDTITQDAYYLQFHHSQPGSGGVIGQAYQSGDVGAKICGVIPGVGPCGEHHVHVQLGSGGDNPGSTNWLDAAQILCK